MKRLVLFSFILCEFLLSFSVEPIQTVYASASEVYYKITNTDTALLRSANRDDIYFMLPSTYFVKLISEYNEDYLFVSYLEFSGYVLKSNVAQVYSTPTTPFLENIVFSPNKVSNLIIRSKPCTQAGFVGTIAFNAENVTYFGWVEGEEVFASLGNIWYYCRYTSAEQGALLGYVYAPLTQNLTTISPNDEVIETTPTKPTSAEITLSPELQSGSNVLFIFLLLIPAIIILLLVFRTHNKRPKRLRNQLRLRDHNDELDF